MHILHVRPQLEIGGAAEYLLALADGFVERGHRVTIAAAGGELVDRAIATGARVHTDVPLVSRIDKRGRIQHAPRLLASAWRLIRIVRSERIDLIHTHHRFAALAAMIASRATGVPTVSTLHETRRDALWLTRLSLGASITVLSEFVRDFVIRSYGVEPARVRVVPMGLPVADPPPSDDMHRLRLSIGIPPGDPVITCVARLHRMKGQIFLLESLPAVRSCHPGVVALLVGDGPERHTLEAAAARLGVGDAVRFLGRRRDVGTILAASTMTVLPSLQEPFGIALLESMAYGRPPVATRVGGISEILDRDRVGLLVPPASASDLADAIVQLLDDPRATDDMGARGRQVVRERYSPERMVEDTEAAYREVLAGRSARLH